MLENTFDYGQVYVALSRVKSVAGLWLSKPIRPQSIRANPAVLEFYSGIHANASTTTEAPLVTDNTVQRDVAVARDPTRAPYAAVAVAVAATVTPAPSAVSALAAPAPLSPPSLVGKDAAAVAPPRSPSPELQLPHKPEDAPPVQSGYVYKPRAKRPVPAAKSAPAPSIGVPTTPTASVAAHVVEVVAKVAAEVSVPATSVSSGPPLADAPTQDEHIIQSKSGRKYIIRKERAK